MTDRTFSNMFASFLPPDPKVAALYNTARGIYPGGINTGTPLNDQEFAALSPKDRGAQAAKWFGNFAQAMYDKNKDILKAPAIVEYFTKDIPEGLERLFNPPNGSNKQAIAAQVLESLSQMQDGLRDINKLIADQGPDSEIAKFRDASYSLARMVVAAVVNDYRPGQTLGETLRDLQFRDTATTLSEQVPDPPDILLVRPSDHLGEYLNFAATGLDKIGQQKGKDGTIFQEFARALVSFNDNARYADASKADYGLSPDALQKYTSARDHMTNVLIKLARDMRDVGSSEAPANQTFARETAEMTMVFLEGIRGAYRETRGPRADRVELDDKTAAETMAERQQRGAEAVEAVQGWAASHGSGDPVEGKDKEEGKTPEKAGETGGVK